MIVMILVLTLICYAVSVPAWTVYKERVHWYRWDYGVPFYGPLFWIAITATGFGAQSLSNLIELFGVYLVSALVPWIRVIFPGKSKATSRRISVICLLFPLILALFLRVFMPVLPE